MAGDIHFDKVSLLLHADGANGSTSIVDSSSTPKTPSGVGTVTISTDLPMVGGSSLKFTGTGAQLAYPASPGFNPGAGAFTVEFLVCLPALSQSQVCITNYQGSSLGWAIAVLPGGGLGINLSGDAYDITAPSGTISANVPTRIALSGQQGEYRLFADGVQVGSTFTGAVSMDTSFPLSIGGLLYSGVWYDRVTGYIDELRITKGLARYTESYTPSVEPFPDGAAVLAGLVRDASNAPAARLIRALREDTGALVGSATSDAATGAYSIGTQYAGAHTLIAYPAAGEALPALALRGVIPA